jgi:3'-phosphoadenosine 5'-phosphosulfate sulfotransferase (PAPS reductase)/FAD synthetase
MLKVFSFGGGVQSTACLVLAAQGKIDYQTFLFCNVGSDSENPETLDYVPEVAIPYARVHGLELCELQKVRRDGTNQVFLSRRCKPLPMATSDHVQLSLFEDGDSCESGYCFV